MPAASNKVETKPSSEVLEPSKQILQIVDKKVRNLEKRKVRSYLSSNVRSKMSPPGTMTVGSRRGNDQLKFTSFESDVYVKFAMLY